MNAIDVNCSAKHGLKPLIGGTSRHKCNICTKIVLPGTNMQVCETCNWYVCLECAVKGLKWMMGPVGPWTVGHVLGQGHTSVVRLGTSKNKKKVKVAIKIINKTYLQQRPSRGDRLRREVAMMKLTHHPNIISLYGVHEDDNYVYIVLEYREGGELFQYILKSYRDVPNGLTEREVLCFLGQIVNGLEYLQMHGLCHRDLKPENLLLDINDLTKEKNIKIADFGFAQVSRRWKNQLLLTNVGSPHYAAPEVLGDEQYYDGHTSDVWSVGIILYAMCTCQLPFDDSHIARLTEKVLTGSYVMPEGLTPEMTDLIRCMLIVNPNQRIQMHNIRKHRAFQKYYPEMYNDLPQSSPPASFNSMNQLSASTCWNEKEILDDEILQDMQALGWGNVEVLRKVLVENDLKKCLFLDSSNEQKSQMDQSRIDREIYLIFERQKIRRIETFSQLTSAKKWGIKHLVRPFTRKKGKMGIKQKIKNVFSFADCYGDDSSDGSSNPSSTHSRTNTTSKSSNSNITVKSLSNSNSPISMVGSISSSGKRSDSGSSLDDSAVRSSASCAAFRSSGSSIVKGTCASSTTVKGNSGNHAIARRSCGGSTNVGDNTRESQVNILPRRSAVQMKSIRGKRNSSRKNDRNSRSDNRFC